MLLLAAGVALGLVVGLQVRAIIERAGVGGLFGGSPLPAAEYKVEKPTEEDRQMGMALAAATGARQLADCRSLAPRHQPGCRAFVQGAQRDGLLPPVSMPPAAERGKAAEPSSTGEWPARLD